MDWSAYLAENPGGGDPVTALWQPSGFVIARSFPLASDAIAWIVRLTFGDDAGPIIRRIGERGATSLDGLRRLAVRLRSLEAKRIANEDRYAPDAQKPLMAGLRVRMLGDSLSLFAFRQAPFDSSVSLIIRPHDARRDGSAEGPPVVGIEWSTVGPGRDERLLLPETLGAALRNCSCAWPDTSETGLTSVVFRIASHIPLRMPKRWSLAGIEWPADRGGIACFGGGKDVGYLVTLPRELASPLIRNVCAGGTDIYGGESFHLNDRPPAPFPQKF